MATKITTMSGPIRIEELSSSDAKDFSFVDELFLSFNLSLKRREEMWKIKH